MNNQQQNNDTSYIANAFLAAQAATKRAKELTIAATYLGSSNNVSVPLRDISDVLQKDAYACSAFIANVRKLEKKGEIVVTSNLDDSTMKLQVSQQSLQHSGLDLGAEIGVSFLPAAKVEEEVTEA